MDSVDEEVMEVLCGGKNPGRYTEVIHLLSHKDHGGNGEQPRRRLLDWGCVNKNKSMLIIAHG